MWDLKFNIAKCIIIIWDSNLSLRVLFDSPYAKGKFNFQKKRRYGSKGKKKNRILVLVFFQICVLER